MWSPYCGFLMMEFRLVHRLFPVGIAHMRMILYLSIYLPIYPSMHPSIYAPIQSNANSIQSNEIVYLSISIYLHLLLSISFYLQFLSIPNFLFTSYPSLSILSASIHFYFSVSISIVAYLLLSISISIYQSISYLFLSMSMRYVYMHLWKTHSLSPHVTHTHAHRRIYIFRCPSIWNVSPMLGVVLRSAGKGLRAIDSCEPRARLRMGWCFQWPLVMVGW